MANKPEPGGPVALVVQRRVADESYAAYARWQARTVERLRAWPGFVAHELIPPSPPENMDWTIIQRFSDGDAARAWLNSPERAQMVGEIQPHLLATEEVHLLADSGPRPQNGATAFISYTVGPDAEADFLAWQRTIYEAEARAPGFLRHKLERPVAGVREDWIIILTFDTAANLSRWLESPERAAFLKEGAKVKADFNLSRTSYGFDFWFRGTDEAKPSGWAILKNNLLVLLVLYPIVFLWGHFLGAPLLGREWSVPFWAALFIGNLVSTQILGWWAVPAIFKTFSWWLAPNPGVRRDILGYGSLIVLYGLSMAVYALLLAKVPV
ncbi:antibiotic biosynthesis monooxygenase [Aquabacter cavernae]|uniref:antibiotic biosynthesis monooxygenase n=1 Tax=Aquabacter cavernae TaxID=2496029 RepID=UPI000F8D730F|nr:antibiotic biosynthesis monooxygenase [Aquabacter cavernae]